MHTRSGTIIAAGVAAAVLGALVVLAYARSVEGQAAPEPRVEAYVATADIPAGTKWEEASGSMQTEEVPESLRPRAAITDENQPEGRTSVRPIGEGEIITSAQFGSEEGGSSSVIELPPGHNAVTINSSVPQGVARFVQPGDLVNVYVTFSGGVDGAPVTKLVLQHIQVLETRVAGRDGDTGDVMLTLALTPDAAERMIFAKEHGSPWFGLVRPGDDPTSTGGRGFGTVLP